MTKQTINKFGKHFLLGVDHDGQNVWLEEFEWDCDWYWAGGYLHTFTNNDKPELSRDIDSHYHIDGLDRSKNLYDAIASHLAQTVMTGSELWLFADLMQSFYTLKKAAEVLGMGGSHLTQHDKIAKREDMAKAINSIIKQEIKPAVEQLLSPESGAE